MAERVAVRAQEEARVERRPARRPRLRRAARVLGFVFGVVVLTLAALTAAVVGAAYAGSMDVTAGRTHQGVVSWFLDTSARRRMAKAAEGIEVPGDLSDPALRERGLLLYHELCQRCHGAPGMPPDLAGRGLSPQPTRLWEGAGPRTEGHPARVWWMIANGLRRSGMPAYGDPLSSRSMWALVAFLQALPKLDAELYRVWVEDATFRAERAAGEGAAPEQEGGAKPEPGIYERVYRDDLYGPWGPPPELGPTR